MCSSDLSSQQGRISPARTGRRRRSFAHQPIPALTEVRKWRQEPQLDGDREQAQQREPSAWDVSQWGHLHIATSGSVATSTSFGTFTSVQEIGPF